MNEDPRYPIGMFDPASHASRSEAIQNIKDLPAKIREAVNGLNGGQLDTPYRDGGWTLRQTVHHVADSHLNAFCRFKLALTEQNPTIRPYHEDLWAGLADARLPVDISLKIIEGIHSRWTALLEAMSDADFQRTFLHPESGNWTLDKAAALYAWHSLHRTAHITHLRESKGW